MNQTGSPDQSSVRIHLKFLKPFQILAAWLLLVGMGFACLFVYSYTPGVQGDVNAHWPVRSRLSRDPGLPTLVLFAHPRCPCSRASIGELERLMPHLKNKVKTYVLFFKPADQAEDWANEVLLKKAQAIPGIEAVLDIGGFEADQFDARTSGQVTLFNSAGVLMFRGGITPGRGHMGDGEGRAAILAFFETGAIHQEATPIFGCSIKKPERAIAGAQ